MQHSQSIPFLNKNVTMEDDINTKQKTFSTKEKIEIALEDKYELEKVDNETINNLNGSKELGNSNDQMFFSNVASYVDDEEEDMYDYIESLSVIEMVNGLLSNMLTEIKNENRMNVNDVINANNTCVVSDVSDTSVDRSQQELNLLPELGNIEIN